MSAAEFLYASMPCPASPYLACHGLSCPVLLCIDIFTAVRRGRRKQWQQPALLGVPLVPPDRQFFRCISVRLSNGRTYGRREAFARLRGWSVCSAVKREQPGVWRLTRILSQCYLSAPQCSSGTPAKLPDKISADRPARDPDTQLHTNQYRRTLALSHHRRLLDCICCISPAHACFVPVCLGWHAD
jgi:hypothetical protein